MQMVMNESNQNKDNVKIIYKAIFSSLIIGTIFEALFFPDLKNLYGCGIFILSWILLYNLVLKKNRIKCFLPYFMMLGLGISFYWLPLMITLVEGKPITFRFVNPFLTFNNQFFNLIMLICAYRFCFWLYTQNNFLHRFWAKLGYFKIPSDAQIWALSFIGLGCFLFGLRTMGTENASAENMGTSGHIISAMQIFAGLPILFFFKELFGGRGNKVNKKWILGYLAIFIMLGIATGKRGTILMPFASMLMCYIIPAILYNKKIFSYKGAILLLVIVYLTTGPVADLAMAMAVGRDDSGKTSSSKTFDNILRIYNDKELLHNLAQAYMASNDNGGDNNYGWSEYYVDNILLDRFCNLRVCDATLYYAKKLGYDNRIMHKYLENQILFQIPTQILKILGNNANKFDNDYTPGDLISTQGLGLRSQYKGFRVAGDTGIGLYLWGYKYYIFAFFIYFAYFYFMSSLVTVCRNKIQIPLPQVLSLMAIFFAFNNATGIVGIIGTLLRVGWQNVVLYCLVLFVIRKIIK